MTQFIAPLLFIALVYVGMVVGNERYGLFNALDHFTRARKIGAYLWLGIFLVLLTILVVASSLKQPTMAELTAMHFVSLFGLHFILLVFLLGWWLLAGKPPLGTYFSFQRAGTGEAVMTGLAVGVGGWIITIVVALILGALLSASGMMSKPPAPPPMITFLAGLTVWKKALIVLSAMTVEELFFRGWLQKRVGVLVSTLLFALAHAGFGQPLLLVGVSVISLIIGFTMYRTKNILPGIVAHGVFDGVQLFVIIPIVFKAAGLG